MINPWQILLDYFEALRERAEHAHAGIADDDDVDVEIADTTPDYDGPRIRVRGAWCGLSSLADPGRDVTFAQRIGINRLDIIVNDHSASRLPRKFDHRPTQQIVTLAKMARDAGIEVHLMSWVMPHREYLVRACGELAELMALTGARSMMWDAEEPWTLAKKRMRYADAGALVAELWADRDFDVGVTGIRYVSTAKLAPLIVSKHLDTMRNLVEAADYLTPQCYATSTSKADPSTVVTKGVDLWRKKFGDGPRMVPGLAAYRQTGIKGHTVSSAMTACLDDADEHSDEVVFWGLNSIRKSPRVANVIEGLRKFDAVPDTVTHDLTTPIV